MNGIRKILLTIPAVLGLVVLITCSLLPGDLEDGVIAIKVGIPSGSRALEVREYDVESLDIAIYGPDGELLTEHQFHWTPPDSEVFWVKGIGSGTYRVVVTHNGVNGDDSLSLIEEDIFEVSVMKITTISIIPGLLSMVEVEGEEPDVTGYWTVAWLFESGFEFEPLYIYFEQDGSVVEAAHGFSGELVDSTFILEGELEWGDFSDTSVLADGEFTGLFEVTDESGAVVVDEDLGFLQGTSRMWLTETEYLGNLTINGDIGVYNEALNQIEMVGISLDTSDALAFNDSPANLSINYFTHEDEVNIDFDLEEGEFGIGDFPITDDPTVSPRAVMSFSYMRDGVDIGVHVQDEGLISLSSYSPEGMAGTISLTGEHNLVITFETLFAPPMPW